MRKVAEAVDLVRTSEQIACTSSHISSCRNCNSALVSTPPESTGRPRPNTARTMVAACPSELTDLMKERSILILSNGNARKLDSDE